MRQLSLFKSKRQRGVKVPPPLEFHDTVFIADVCRRWLQPGWDFTHLPFGEHRTDATAARLKRMGVKAGWPDFVFIGTNQRLFFLELKRVGGRLSDEQIAIHAHIIACGFPVRVAFGAKQAIAILKELNILRSNIEVQ